MALIANPFEPKRQPGASPSIFHPGASARVTKINFPGLEPNPFAASAWAYALGPGAEPRATGVTKMRNRVPVVAVKRIGRDDHSAVHARIGCAVSVP
jgi:hypothetical protein